MKNKNVRFGSSARNKPNWIRFLLPVLIGLIIFAGLVVVLKRDVKPQKKNAGCLSDKACPEGSICAVGGCIILLNSEIADMWHDDIASQLDAAVSWNPRSTFGEKLYRVTNCENILGKVSVPNFKTITPLMDVSLYEFESDLLRIHKFKRAEASLWLERLRIDFGQFLKKTAESICVSDSIDKYQFKKNDDKRSNSYTIDVSLAQAAPAGRAASVAASIDVNLPTIDSNGFRTISIPLKETENEKKVIHNLVAFPLGSTIKSIMGPPPTRQRLLSGYIVYYWRAQAESSSAIITFKLPSSITQDLDLTKLNP